MKGNLGLVAGLALLASVTAGLLGFPLAGLSLGVLGIGSAVALGLTKRAKGGIGSSCTRHQLSQSKFEDRGE